MLFKLIVVLVGGIFMFNGDTNPKRLIGMAITFGMVVVYSVLKQRISENWDKAPAARAAEKEEPGLPLVSPNRA